jgi:hypothetical protein
MRVCVCGGGGGVGGGYVRANAHRILKGKGKHLSLEKMC